MKSTVIVPLYPGIWKLPYSMLFSFESVSAADSFIQVWTKAAKLQHLVPKQGSENRDLKTVSRVISFLGYWVNNKSSITMAAPCAVLTVPCYLPYNSFVPKALDALSFRFKL